LISADDIADLNDRLIGLQQAKDAEKEQYESELQKLKNEFQETKDQLQSENMIQRKCSIFLIDPSEWHSWSFIEVHYPFNIQIVRGFKQCYLLDTIQK